MGQKSLTWVGDSNSAEEVTANGPQRSLSASSLPTQPGPSMEDLEMGKKPSVALKA